jgi:hypothetical protein
MARSFYCDDLYQVRANYNSARFYTGRVFVVNNHNAPFGEQANGRRRVGRRGARVVSHPRESTDLCIETNLCHCCRIRLCLLHFFLEDGGETRFYRPMSFFGVLEFVSVGILHRCFIEIM